MYSRYREGALRNFILTNIPTKQHPCDVTNVGNKRLAPSSHAYSISQRLTRLCETATIRSSRSHLPLDLSLTDL